MKYTVDYIWIHYTFILKNTYKESIKINFHIPKIKKELIRGHARYRSSVLLLVFTLFSVYYFVNFERNHDFRKTISNGVRFIQVIFMRFK